MEQTESVRLAGLEEKVEGIGRRVSRLEKDQTALNRLATAVEVLSTRQESTQASLDRLSEKVSALEAKPGRRWEALADKVLFAAAGAVLAWLASGAPGIS